MSHCTIIISIFIDIIGSIIAEVNINKVKDKDIVKITPIIYDKNGNKMNIDDLELDTKTLNATIHMYETKTIPLTLSVYNTNDLGEILSYSYEKDEIICSDVTCGAYVSWLRSSKETGG